MPHIRDYIINNLNEEQSQAALHTDTSSLILAGAGSGKTRTLTFKIAYLLFEKNIPPQQILAVTFTNKAAAEMKERLVSLAEKMSMLAPDTTIQEQNITSSDDSILSFIHDMEQQAVSKQTIPKVFNERDFMWLGTFHSIFLKILKEDITSTKMKYSKSFSIFDTNESKTIIKDILKHMGVQDVFKDAEVKNVISKVKNEGMLPEDFLRHVHKDYDHTMGKIYEQYQRRLEEANALDFDDLLLLPYHILKTVPEVLAKWQKQFRYIMVDEAQDTNWIQFELMKMLSGTHGNITLIGDDFQSIYGWRGAVMENFLNVKKYWPDVQIFKLQTNYRSRAHIVRAGSHIIKNNVNQYQKDIIPHRKEEDTITIFAHRDEMDEAMNMVSLIKKMRGSKFENWWDIAILYRTNAQSSPFEQILLQEGIPYKVWGAYKFFERKEIKDILAYLKYINNPRDNISLKRIINIPTRKIGKSTIQVIEDYAIANDLTMNEVVQNITRVHVDLGAAAVNAVSWFMMQMQEIITSLPQLTPAELIEKIISKINYRSYLVKEEGSENAADEKYENIGQLINMAGKYHDTGEAALRQFMEEITLLSDIAENEQGDIDAIKLMTVHASKWLEFPFVFIVGLEEQIFPLANAIMETKLLEEERRLMYVAITRAKDHVFGSYAHSRMQWGQTKMNAPSRFIDELPADLVKKYDLGGGNNTNIQRGPDIDEWDSVRHKLFGPWYVLEVWNNQAIVKFHNPKFGVRKIETRFLDIV